MGAKSGIALFFVGCAATVPVVQVPARELPPLPPAEVSSATAPTAEVVTETDDIGAVDLDDSPGVPVLAPAPAARMRRTCPPGTTAVGSSCLTPVSKSGPATNACSLLINSIPVTHVFVDGGYLGPTPQIDVKRAAGTHTVMFLTDDETQKKSLTVTCAAGERKTVAAKLAP
jgi:hypothetical protein